MDIDCLNAARPRQSSRCAQVSRVNPVSSTFDMAVLRAHVPKVCTRRRHQRSRPAKRGAVPRFPLEWHPHFSPTCLFHKVLYCQLMAFVTQESA